MWVKLVVIFTAAAVQLTSAYEFLLPRDLVPVHYDVRLLYDIDQKTNYSFYGVVDIVLNTIKPTSKIILHAQDFTIHDEEVVLTGDTTAAPGVKSVTLNETYNLLTLELEGSLEKDRSYNLTIPFSGNLKQGLDGAYISSYVNKKTDTKEYLISTQFEAISARKAFPCFDEPIMKATFRITIGHNKGYTAVSNMPLEKQAEDNALESYWPWEVINQTFKKPITEFTFSHFDKSVPMSTYLVAYVVSKFTFKESPAGLSSTKFRIWARSDAIDQTEYASTVGPKVLSHFEQWFNVTFPLPKQDMFAIPDFSAGAMENWGLITYRETALLYDRYQSSFTNKERVAEVIAHELAHQWFGNLVTMKWWSDLWLNEGFATFAASVGVNAVEPTWGKDKNNAVDDMQVVLGFDALESSHPVSVPIDDPKRISEIFDEISYRKGSVLIRMMTMFLGDKVFREAIHNYLVKHSYSNAEQDDLWAELTECAKKYSALSRNVTVKTIMDTWTTKTGYPLLTVERNYESKSLTISQKRYLSIGARESSASSWWVPLRVVAEGEDESTALAWLADNEGVEENYVYEHEAEPHQWILFNADMIAPYRVNYDIKNWNLLTEALRTRHTTIPLLGRAQLLTDAFELAWSGRLDYSVPLQLASYLQKEKELQPLETGLRALEKIENVLKRSPDYGAFQKFVRKIITDIYLESGGLAVKKIINEEDLNSVKKQALTSRWACRMKVPGCEENALQLFHEWMNTENPDENNPIPLDLRDTVYCAGLSRGSVAEWRFALARKRRANVAAAADTLQRALACTREIWILAQYLEWAITDGSEVRRQDAASVIVGVLRSTVGYYLAKDFIYTRIDDLSKAFHNQDRKLGFIIKTLLTQFTTQRELDEFETWRASNTKYLTEIKLALEQAVERAKLNIDWVTRNKQAVVDQLRKIAADNDDTELLYNSATGIKTHPLISIRYLLYLLCTVEYIVFL